MHPSKTRPILFSGPMVRAILAGTKIQTRRVVRPQPEHKGGRAVSVGLGVNVDLPPGWYWKSLFAADKRGFFADTLKWSCPYGAPGDRLWVREALESFDEPPYEGARYAADKRTVRLVSKGGHMETDAGWTWKRKTLPSIFMPRDLSRITLEITEVGAQRLHDITPKDVAAEGLTIDLAGKPFTSMNADVATEMFARLWNKLNDKRGFGWETNPWIWVVEFRRVTD